MLRAEGELLVHGVAVRPGHPVIMGMLRGRPVIGVPIDSGPLCGLDALLATVQMPGGIPVATVAVGKAGARNAGYLAAQMLGFGDAALTRRLEEDREGNRAKIQAQNERLQAELKG